MRLQYHTALQCTRIRNRWLVFQPVQGTQSLEKEQLQLASKLRQLEGGRPVLQKLPAPVLCRVSDALHDCNDFLWTSFLLTNPFRDLLVDCKAHGVGEQTGHDTRE